MKVKKRIAQNRKTKYPFSTIQVSGEFKVKTVDYNSMLTSLRAFNKRHNLSIKVTAEDVGNNHILITRVA